MLLAESANNGAAGVAQPPEKLLQRSCWEVHGFAAPGFAHPSSTCTRPLKHLLRSSTPAALALAAVVQMQVEGKNQCRPLHFC